MRCCAECFGDRGLRRSIIPLRSTERGRCSYCDTEDVAVVSPEQLAEYFELLASAYIPDPQGRPLVLWLREDWGMFQHPRMDDARARDLVGNILNDAERMHHTVSPAVALGSDRVGEWEKLRDELMYQNRFFPNANIDLERLEFLLSPLTLDVDEVPDIWYRARIKTQDEAFSIEEMGAPPKRIASHGRANPAGIPYLYLGSTVTTAISEIRPHTGEVVCVANFRTSQDLKLVDLRAPRRMVSPFVLVDAEDIGKMRSDLPFLERLGDELTRPVVPQSAAIDYTPSQYVCEFIKKCGYHGVIYRSSVSDGINLAVFDPARPQPGEVTEYEVARVLVDVAPLLKKGPDTVFVVQL